MINQFLAGVSQGYLPLIYIQSTLPVSCYSLTTYTFTYTAILFPIIATHHLQPHLNNLEPWLRKWRLKVNQNNCMHLIFTFNPKKILFCLYILAIFPLKQSLKSRTLPCAPSSQLGILILSSMNWSKLLFQNVGKCSKLALQDKSFNCTF